MKISVLVYIALALASSAFAQLPQLPPIPPLDPLVPVAPVPEGGATWILLACGMAALAAFRHRVTKRRG